MKFVRFYFWLGVWGLSMALAHQVEATPKSTQGLNSSHIFPAVYEEQTTGKYFVNWKGKPEKTWLQIVISSELYYPSNSDEGIQGVLVRVQAFDVKGHPAGQINGPGDKDDIFLTGQKCSFTPFKPGNYVLRLEVLGSNRRPVAVMGYDFNPKRMQTVQKMAQEISLLVYKPPKPVLKVVYEQWHPSEEQPGLYQRQIGLSWENIDKNVPTGYPYYVSRSDIKRELPGLQLRVVPITPVPNLDKISWVSKVVPPHFWDSYASTIAIQYFRYDPTRDTPRNPNFFTVKAKVGP